VRYYSIQITRSNGQTYQFKSTGNSFSAGITLTSLLPNGPQSPLAGLTNPSALQIEFDIPQANFTDPDGQAAWLRIWGLGLQDLGAAADLNNLQISISGGMAKGLPLANPTQAGLLMKGTILQAFGNWQGTDQTLDMIFAVGDTSAGIDGIPGAADTPGNFPFNMTAGMPLSTAITNTLSIGMPNIPVSISISPKLVLGYNVVAHFTSRNAFSQFCNTLSTSIIGETSGYSGVQIVSSGAALTAFDGEGTAAPAMKTIQFQDLIGQPTWIDQNTISFKCVLRSDIHQGDTVTLPRTLFTQTSAQNAQFANKPQTSLTFSGNFLVQKVHHYGHSRQGDASSWNTTYQATQA
jgi:hypothetical protein